MLYKKFRYILLLIIASVLLTLTTITLVFLLQWQNKSYDIDSVRFLKTLN